MRKFVFVGLTGSIALTVASCSSHSEVKVATTPSPDSPSSSETSIAQQPSDAKSTTALIPQVSAPENIPGLVQSTNSGERARQTKRIIDSERRQDPSAAVPVVLQQPRPRPDRTAIPLRQMPFPTPISRPTKMRKRTPAPQVAYGPYVRPLPTKNKPRTALYPQQNRPVITTLPPLPSAELANAVEVSGVIVVGKVTQVIVKAPNEVSSRYVKPGQRLSNGEILVKRVEMSADSDPTVILEENGIEVVRTIGITMQAVKPV
jgi:hypothetical protein